MLWVRVQKPDTESRVQKMAIPVSRIRTLTL